MKQRCEPEPASLRSPFDMSYLEEVPNSSEDDNNNRTKEEILDPVELEQLPTSEHHSDDNNHKRTGKRVTFSFDTNSESGTKSTISIEPLPDAEENIPNYCGCFGVLSQFLYYVMSKFTTEPRTVDDSSKY